jgi:nicotinate-nucleotide adenylyltransferase
VKGANLDRLIIMPAFIPPHKEYTSTVSCEDRLEMCKLAFKDVEKATVSDLEISRGGKSYTYLTLQELSRVDTELYFLCGTDMILTMGTWKMPEIIFSLANICYIRREKDGEADKMIKQRCEEYKETYNANIIPINAEVIEISSSQIRNKSNGSSQFLTDEVADYIRRARLYE